MPHPDRAWDRRLGSEDGQLIFESLVQYLESQTARR
jgi:phosphoribosylformylglycinamidine (FGAM) synthase-like amidotransferase family enzyme